MRKESDITKFMKKPQSIVYKKLFAVICENAKKSGLKNPFFYVLHLLAVNIHEWTVCTGMFSQIAFDLVYTKWSTSRTPW